MDNVKEKFCEIYHARTWQKGTSISGSGSEVDQTTTLIKYLSFIINLEGIKSIVDCPCGDMNWQEPLIKKVVRYVGCDVVPELITENIERLIERASIKPKNLGFRVIDIINDELPPCDLLIVRDCLVHLTNDMIFMALENIAMSGSRLVGITSFLGRGQINDITPEQWGNLDIWRPLDLMAEPFGLPFPKHVIIEGCTEGDSQYRDKSLMIWETNQLREWLNSREG